MSEKIVISVSYDEMRGGYIGTAPDLPSSAQPLVALSLGGLRRLVEKILPNTVVVLHLDKVARRERDARRKGGAEPGVWDR
jgi:hypothetical protein